MRRLLLALALLAAPAVGQLCDETFTLRTTACPAGSDCVNKGASISAAEYDANVTNDINVCLAFDDTDVVIAIDGRWQFDGELEVPASTTPPGTCTQGELYVDTDAATPAERFLFCSATDTWTIPGGGVGGGATSEAELESDLADVTDVYTDNDIDFIAAADMADADHGDVDWTSGVATVQAMDANIVDSAELVDGGVDESHLNIANDPEDEYILTYEVDTTNFQWVASAGGGATSEAGLEADLTDTTNVLTDNDASITFDAGIDLITAANGDIDLSPNGTGEVNVNSPLNTQASATPTLVFKDSDASAGDDNATISGNCTDTGDGTEDCDLTVQQQVAGTPTNAVVFDADGAGTARVVFPDDSIGADEVWSAGQVDGDVLTWNTGDVLSWEATAAGTPGGSTTEIQFNNAGSFDGDSQLTWNDTTKVVTIGTGSPTQDGLIQGPGSTYDLHIDANGENLTLGDGGTNGVQVADAGATTFIGTGSLALPNGATPTTDATAEVALDTTITDHQPLMQYYDGGENMTVIAVDTAQLPATDNEIIKYDAGTDKFVLEADVGAGSGDDVSVDSVDVTNPDFVSTGDVDFVDTTNTITANLNIDVVDATHMADADHGDVAWSSGAATVDTIALETASLTALADDEVLVGDGAASGTFLALQNCNDTTEKLDWTGTAFACVTDQSGGSTSWDVTDTDANPVLTVDDTEQVQFIGAGTVTIVAAADASNHDVTITGSAHDGTGTDDQVAAEVPFTPDTGGEWTGSPAEVDAALEDLAPRVTTNDAKVTESTSVTDNADGMDITLSTYDIAVALDPSEVVNQAPDLADLVPYEDVTDGGIHHATFTQVQTLVDTTSVETAADITMGGDISSTADSAQVDDVQSATTNLEAADNNTTQVASTSFVQQEINDLGGTDLTCSSGTCNVDNPVTAATTATTATLGDSATAFFSGGEIEKAYLPDVEDLDTTGGTDGHHLQQTGATTYEFDWTRIRYHASDCTSLTDGEQYEPCWELDDNTLYVCETATCNAAGWTSATAAGDGVGYDTVEEADTPLTQRANLNFLDGTRATMSCADDVDTTDCTVEAVATLSSYTDDLSHVEESTTVTDNADGMDITLSTYDITVALDPSEVANQAGDLADLVPYEDVTDGGIHHMTFTQVQTLVADGTGTDDQNAAEVPFTPDDGGEWTGSPAEVDAALEDLAPRVTANDAKTTFPGFDTVANDYSEDVTDDDLSDDLIIALSGVTTVTDGSFCQGGATNTMDCDVLQTAIPGTDHIDDIGEIATALKSGADAELITGTIATTNAVVAPDANDDLVEYASLVWNVTAATCTGDGNGGALTVNGSNEVVCTADDGGGSSFWSQSGTAIYPTTTGDEVVLGASAELQESAVDAKFSIDGDADQPQVMVQGNATQNNSLMILEQSDGTNVLTVANDGTTVFGTGAADGLIQGSGSTYDLLIDPNGNEVHIGQSKTNSLVVDDTGDVTFAGTATLALPQTADPTTEGVVGWDVANEQLEIGETTTTAVFKQVGTFNDEQFCTAETTGNQIDCDTSGSLADDNLADDDITALNGVTTITDGSFCQGGASDSMDCDVLQTAIPGTGHIDNTAEISADVVTTTNIDDASDSPVEGEILAVSTTTTQVNYVPPQPICKTLFDQDGLADTDDVSSIYRWGSAAIITEAWCEIDAGTNATITLATSVGADNVTSNCACTTGGLSCTLSDTTMDDGELIDLVIVSLSGTPDRLTFCMEHRYDL